MGNKEKTPLDAEMMGIILWVPKRSRKLKVLAKLLDEDGNIIKAKTTLRKREIDELRMDFLQNVIGGDDYDEFYGLTEYGMELAENGDPYDLP